MDQARQNRHALKICTNGRHLLDDEVLLNVTGLFQSEGSSRSNNRLKHRTCGRNLTRSSKNAPARLSTRGRNTDSSTLKAWCAHLRNGSGCGMASVGLAGRCSSSIIIIVTVVTAWRTGLKMVGRRKYSRGGY